MGSHQTTVLLCDVSQTLEYLVASFAKVDTCGVSTPGALVAVDEAHVGWSHLQHGISPHMLILGAACTPSPGWTQSYPCPSRVLSMS